MLLVILLGLKAPRLQKHKDMLLDYPLPAIPLKIRLYSITAGNGTSTNNPRPSTASVSSKRKRWTATTVQTCMRTNITKRIRSVIHMPSFPGVYVALVTPMKEDYSVDIPRLKELCEWLIAEGVDGLVPAGSLGEYATLSKKNAQPLSRRLSQ